MELTIQGKFDLYSRSGGYSVIVYKARLAKRLNTLLKSYPDDVCFTIGDEPLFSFTENDLLKVLTLLGVKRPSQFLNVDSSPRKVH